MKLISFFLIFFATILANANQQIVLISEPLYDLAYHINETSVKGLQVSVFLDEDQQIGTISAISQLSPNFGGVQTSSNFFGKTNEMNLLSENGTEKIYEINHINQIIPIVRVIVTIQPNNILPPDEWLNYVVNIKTYRVQFIERNDGSVLREINLVPAVTDSRLNSLTHLKKTSVKLISSKL